MTDDLFHSLALKVLAGQASPEEKDSLEKLLAASTERCHEFTRLKETFQILQASSPLAQAAEKTQPGLPAYRLGELRSAVHREFPEKSMEPEPLSWWTSLFGQRTAYASVAMALLLLSLMIVNHRSGVELGAYEDTLMRNGETPAELGKLSRQTFQNDEEFEDWKNSRFGPELKIWFDEANDQIVVVETGGLFSANKVLTYPLPADDNDRIKALEEILQPKN